MVKHAFRKWNVLLQSLSSLNKAQRLIKLGWVANKMPAGTKAYTIVEALQKQQALSRGIPPAQC